MTTWNPTDKAAGITLSGGNLIATHTGTNAFYETVRGTTSKTGGGKFVAKLTFSNIGTPAECGFGIANASASLGNSAPDYLGVDANGVACYNGSVAYNNANISTVSFAGQGPFFAFDLTNSTLKTSTDGTTWSGPATFTIPAGAVFLAVCLYDTNDVATLDPAPTGWTLAGYSNWDAGAATTYTLTAAVKSIPLTKRAANLTFSRALPAVKKTISITKRASNLVYARIMPAAKKTITITKQAAILTHGWSMPAVKKSVPITKQVTNLIMARRLAASLKSVPITKRNANLVMGYRLVAAPKSVPITKRAATLTYSTDKVMQAAFRTIPITKFPVGLILVPVGGISSGGNHSMKIAVQGKK